MSVLGKNEIADSLSQRFIEIFDPNMFTNTVDIAGAGSVGSAVSLALAKMGLKINIYDPDIVSAENVGVSLLYGFEDIGKPKVEVLKNRIETLTGPDFVNSFISDYNPKESANIIISTVDTIAARKNIFGQFLNNGSSHYFIDTAMGGLVVYVKYVDKSDNETVKKYMNYISGLDDDSVPQIRCTARSTVFGPMLIAARVASVIVGIYHKECQSDKWSKKIEIPDVHMYMGTNWFDLTTAPSNKSGE